jgi:exodeoxyribonuclease V beta subunit
VSDTPSTATLPSFDPTGPLRPGRVLLEASAGTGKTHTITSLVLRLIAEEGLRIEQLLVVTFTRAATAELRERVRARIAGAVRALEWARANQGAVPERADEVVAHLITSAADDEALALRHRALARAREEFDDATISTIHGFCQQALQRAGLDADVDLEAELVEDLSDLLEEIVDDFLVRELRGGDDEVYAYLRDNKVGRDDLLGLAARVEAEPDLRLHPDLDLEAVPAVSWDELVTRCREAWRRDRDDAETWIAGLREGGAFNPRGTKYTEKSMAKRIAAIDAWCDEAVPTLGELGPVAKHLKDLTPAGVAAFLVEGATLTDEPPVVAELARLLAHVGRPATVFRLRFAHHVRDEVERRKRQRGILSFADLLRSLADALETDETREALRATIRERYAAALIDEFQDTDPVQWKVFDTVFDAGSRLYLIGDPKQAIYAFRGADMATYLRAAGTVEEQRTLPTNWRSDQRYLDALHGLLDRPDAFGTRAIPYIPVRAPEHHQADRLTFPDRRPPTLEVRHVPRALAAGPDGTVPTRIDKGWADRTLPRLVAADIVSLLDSGAVLHDDEGSSRALAPGDVAVLTRTNRQARLVERLLSAAGVPAVTATDQSVFATYEAVCLQRVLDACLFSATDREARAALTTPLLGVDADELLELDDVGGWDEWLDRLAGWSRRWRDDGVAVMLRALLADTDAPRRLVAQPGGERVLTNVRHLAEILHRAEAADRRGPASLAAWLREQRHLERPDAQDLELRLESDADAVQILTVHRAKGLQYPVVWCPWLWEGKLLFQGEERTLRFHDPEDGALAMDLDLALDIDPKARHLTIAARERWEESLRLAYVALTRAEHRCVVYTGAFKESGPSPLGHLLHDRSFVRDEQGRDVPPDDPDDVDDEELLAQLNARANGALGVSVVQRPAPVPPWQGRDPTRHPLSAHSFERGLDRQWRRTSFTALTRATEAEPGSPEAEGRDLDQHSEQPVEAVTAAPAAAPLRPPVEAPSAADTTAASSVPLAAFARGPDAGTFLHEVLERFDFAEVDEPGVLEALVDERLRRAGLGRVERPPLHAGLRAVLRTPLGPLAGEVTLTDVPRGQRLDELDFDLPLAGGYAAGERAITLGAIAEVLHAHAGDDAATAAAAERLRARSGAGVRGFLTGSIDLVFRADGRFLVADYKSNWVGDRGLADGGESSTVDHYHPARLADVMVGHDYLLQAHLYLVALHRYLGWRLGDAYDYDEHVGGFVYLFLRGMVGPDTPRATDGTPHGVFGRRPPRALVEDLDALLRGGR